MNWRSIHCNGIIDDYLEIKNEIEETSCMFPQGINIIRILYLANYQYIKIIESSIDPIMRHSKYLDKHEERGTFCFAIQSIYI